MSGAALGWAKAQVAPSCIAKVILICLADYADADAMAWPKIKTLAKEAQVSPRTVQRALRQLEDEGLITSDPRWREDRGQTSNGYRLALPHDNLTCPPRQNVVPPTSPVSPPIEPPLKLLSSDEEETRAQSDFDRFWQAYPHKVGRKAAVKAWTSAKDRPPLARLLAAVDRYRQSKPADRAWCNPATWLNQGRWADETGQADTGADHEPPAAPTFDGPADLRAAVVREQDEDFARRWLDHYCRWRAADRTLIATRGIVAETLKRELVGWLDRARIRVEVA